MPLLTLTVFLLCANTPMITVYGRNRGNPCELPSLGSCMPILSILVHFLASLDFSINCTISEFQTLHPGHSQRLNCVVLCLSASVWSIPEDPGLFAWNGLLA